MKNENRDEIIKLISPKNKSYVDVMNEDVRLFTKDYYMGYAASFPYKGDNYAPHSIVLQWQVEDLCDEFIVRVSPVEDFSIIEDYHVNGAKLELFAPFFYDEYFWCVISVDGRYSSRIYSFKIKNQTRPIYIDGVSNTREVFFGNTIEGFKIARNRLYRGGNVDSITELGKEFVQNKLAIKTDLDLRKPTESTASLETSAMGESVKHLNKSVKAFDLL